MMQSKQVATKVSGRSDRPSIAGTEIDKDNIRALGIIYFAAMLENARLFQVVDKLIESFNNGLLPVGRGSAGQSLFKYWKNSQFRLSQADRRNLYKRVFGLSGGDDSATPNKEFDDLWIRFISAVTALSSSGKVSAPVNQEQVRKAGRDLAANLSLHGYGSAHFVAAELKKQIQDIVDILSTPEIKAAYGARDAWQVIDRISDLELRGSGNLLRYRTMADSGATIIMWLANNSQKLTRATGPLLHRKLTRKTARRARFKANTTPTDSDLINSCEQWLAVAGVPDDRIDESGRPNT
jgi:hypothetical protein